MHKVLESIIELYSQRTGLSPTALSIPVWESILDERMQVNQFTDPWDYYQKWLNFPSEYQHFLDRLVVLETWFFRDKAAFNYLTSYAFNEWYPKNQNNPNLRILSVPCSTGEEPYSIAIALIKSGFPARLFSVDAVDISQQAIAKAELGIYGKNSFRSKDVPDLSTFFISVEEGSKISQTIHQQVHFRVGNVFDHGFLCTKPKYDIIFCRNLLIYLHQEAQNQLLQTLRNLLTTGGVLFTGATEGEIVRKFGFIPCPAPRSSAFYNTKTEVKKVASVRHKRLSEKMEAVPKQEPNAPVFEKAKQYADEGLFEDAIAECLSVLQNNGPTAEGYCLLAVIMHASNRKDQAEEFFKKALYLDPEYQEALVYMVLLAEARGDQDEAQRYRERVERLKRSKAVKS